MLTLNNLNFIETPPQPSSEKSQLNETSENFAAILGGISALLQQTGTPSPAQNQEFSSNADHEKISFSTEKISFSTESPDVEPAVDPSLSSLDPMVSAKPETVLGAVGDSARENGLKFITELAVETEVPQPETQYHPEIFHNFNETLDLDVDILEIPTEARILAFNPTESEPRTEILIEEDRPLNLPVKILEPIGINPHSNGNLFSGLKVRRTEFKIPEVFQPTVTAETAEQTALWGQTEGFPVDFEPSPKKQTVFSRNLSDIEQTVSEIRKSGLIDRQAEAVKVSENFDFEQQAALWEQPPVETPPIIVLEKPDLPNQFPKHDGELGQQNPVVGLKFGLNRTESAETEKASVIEPNVAEQIEPRLLEIAGLVRQKDEKQILRMRLHPAELGTVEINLEKNAAGVLEAQFQTENESAKQVLSQNLEKLREALQDAGWQIGRMEVFQQSFSSTANQNRQQEPEQSEYFQYDFPDRTSTRNTDARAGADENSARRLVSLRA